MRSATREGIGAAMSRRAPALSASRAKDFKQCPLKFRYAVVDRIPQPPTVATIKGTLVHAVLEHLFELPQPERTMTAAFGLITPTWESLAQKHNDYLQVVEDDSSVRQLNADAQALLQSYFSLEQPQNLRPTACESFVEAQLDSGLRLRGIIDRIEHSPAGKIRVIDYKTGKAPSSRFVDEALFQMRFYALMLQAEERLPDRMQLLYLKSGQVLTLDPQPEDIERFQIELMELWGQISDAATSGDFAPQQGPLCNWCAFQSQCPLFGGTVAPPAEADLQRILAMRAEPRS